MLLKLMRLSVRKLRALQWSTRSLFAYYFDFQNSTRKFMNGMLFPCWISCLLTPRLEKKLVIWFLKKIMVEWMQIGETCALMVTLPNAVSKCLKKFDAAIF